MAKTPETVGEKLRAAGFQIAERKPPKEPVWAKRFKGGKVRKYRQSEALRLVEGK